MGRTIKLANETYLVNDIHKTSEIKVGKWIDGKPIYRKVVETTMPIDGAARTATTISNLDKIINFEGFVSYSSQLLPFSFFYGSTSFPEGGEYICWYKEGNNIVVRTNQSNYWSKSCYMIIEYTKTTD